MNRLTRSSPIPTFFYMFNVFYFLVISPLKALKQKKKKKTLLAHDCQVLGEDLSIPTDTKLHADVNLMHVH